VCDLETSRIGAPYIHDISRLRVKQQCRNKQKLLQSVVKNILQLFWAVKCPFSEANTNTV